MRYEHHHEDKLYPIQSPRWEFDANTETFYHSKLIRRIVFASCVSHWLGNIDIKSSFRIPDWLMAILTRTGFATPTHDHHYQFLNAQEKIVQ